MLSLSERFSGITSLIEESESMWRAALKSGAHEETTFFDPLPLNHIISAVHKLLGLDARLRKSLDMGCGLGSWALMMAAAGIDSYGIDVDPYLIMLCNRSRDIAIERGYIPKGTDCRFAAGNMYPKRWHPEYGQEQRIVADQDVMPIHVEGRPYDELGIRMRDMDVIYAFPYEEQMPFLCRVFTAEARSGTIIALPHHPYHYPPKGQPIGKYGLTLKILSTDVVFLGEKV